MEHNGTGLSEPVWTNSLRSWKAQRLELPPTRCACSLNGAHYYARVLYWYSAGSGQKQRARNSGNSSVSSVVVEELMTRQFPGCLPSFSFFIRRRLDVACIGRFAYRPQTSQIPAGTAVATSRIRPAAATCGTLHQTFAGGDDLGINKHEATCPLWRPSIGICYE